MGEVHLEQRPEGLTLTDGELELRGDFTTELSRLKYNNLTHEFIVKAAKIKNPDHELIAVDATAGMGEDSILLAAAGFTVELYEYNHVIAELLRDALDRAANIPELSEIVSRMHLHEENSIEALKQLNYVPDVVVLDPMFPERQKSASVKKKFQLLQKLESPCGDENELMAAALSSGAHKIVVKRPAKGPCLAGIKPSYSLEGKAIRYDCIVR